LPAYSEVSEEIVITQMAQGEITLSVSPEKTSIIPKGGGDADVITVTTDAGEWDYTAPAWLGVKEKTATTLTLTASAAPLGSRIGIVTITAGDKSRQVEVIQRGLADIMDLIFNADGTATNIADPELPVITVPYEKTDPNDVERLITVRNETYGRYIARFNRPVSTWVSGYIVSSGFYRLEYGTVVEKIADGHSFEALVTTNDLTGFSMKIISMQGDAAGSGLYLANDKFCFTIHNGSSYVGVTNASESATAGTYYHLAGVYAKGTVTLYINGTPYSYNNANADMKITANEDNRWVGIGADTGADKKSDGGWVGDIVMARVYDAPLTAEQVAALYAEINE
jgi:hypothetical protein